MKKSSLQISQRDKKLLILLIAVLIGFLCYTYIISPALDQGNMLKQQLKNLQNEHTDAGELVSTLPELETREAEKKSELVDKYAPFFYELNQERILYKLNSLFQDSGLTVTKYEQKELVIESIAVPQYDYNTAASYPILKLAAIINSDLLVEDLPEQEPEEDEDAEDTDIIAADAVPSFTIVLYFDSSNYDSIMSFIRELEGMNKAIVIDTIIIEQSETDLSGEIELSFYAIPKIEESENDYLEFIPSMTNGKTDPFK